MARRRLSRAASRAGSDDDDRHSVSTVSLGGRTSTAADEAEFEHLADDPFHDSVELLYEKRAASREAGLKRLIELLTSMWQYEECTLRQETFANMFLGSLKRGGATEAALAARAIGLHSITLGATDASERMYREALPALEPIILTGKVAAVRIAAIDALSMLCFVGSEGTHDTLECMALLTRAYSRGLAKVQAAALRAWTLLLTTVPAWQLGSAFVDGHLSLLVNLLHSEDVEARVAAGEAVALLYNMCGLAELPQSPRHPPGALASQSQPAAANGAAAEVAQTPADPSTAPDSRVYGVVEAHGSQGAEPGASSGLPVGPPPNGVELTTSQAPPVKPLRLPPKHPGSKQEEAPVEGLDEIVSRMRDLAKNRGDAQRRSKKDRASLRSSFRELCSVVEDGESPVQKIKLRHGDVLVVDTLEGNVRLSALRRFLSEGFQAHMQANPLLHEVFRFKPRHDAPEKLSALEKRMFRSPASAESKARTQDRKKERAMMAAYKGSMLYTE